MVMKVPSVAPKGAAVPANTSIFDAAMLALLSSNADEKVVFDAVDLLGKIVSNIIQNPNEEKYRKIKQTSAALNKKLLEVSGGMKCFESLGFQSVGDEYVLAAAAENWQNLLGCKTKLDGFRAKLSLKIDGGGATTSAAGPPPQVPRWLAATLLLQCSCWPT